MDDMKGRSLQPGYQHKLGFIFQPTEKFSAKLAKVRKKDLPAYGRILGVVERLLENPGDSDGKMVGLYHGRLKKYVGRRDYRLIYHWCEECRKENKKISKKCENCDTVHDNSVIFFDLYHKNEKNKLHHFEEAWRLES